MSFETRHMLQPHRQYACISQLPKFEFIFPVFIFRPRDGEHHVSHAAQQRIFQFSFVNDIPRVTWSTSNAKIRHNFERQIRIRSSIYSSFDRFAHGTFPREKCWVSLRNVERKISWKECRLVFVEFINLYLNLDASRIQRILTNYDSFNL